MSELAERVIRLLQPVLPTKRGSILFMSYDGMYADSPKSLSEKLHSIRPQLDFYWHVERDKANLGQLPSYVKPVSGIRAIWQRARSQVVVDNVYGRGLQEIAESTSGLRRLLLRASMGNRSRTVVTTWHGTPLKRMGVDQVGSKTRDVYCERMIMCLGNSYSAHIMDRLTFGKVDVRITGTPRNDPLVDAPATASVSAKESLGLPANRHIALYAPTFRSGTNLSDKDITRSGLRQLQELDVDRLLNCLADRFGGQWLLVPRFHYHVANLIDRDALAQTHPSVVLGNIQQADMVDCLLAADCLITDASSSMFDFALTGRPCFVLFPDFEHYSEAERGLYLGFDDLPFPFAVDSRSLCAAVECFDAQAYSSGLESLFELLGMHEDGAATQRVARLVIQLADER